MNMCATLRISLPLLTVAVLPGLARAQFVDQAVSVLHEQAERKAERALERGAARLEGELGKVAGKVTGHIGRKVGESLADVQEEVAEIKARVETVKAALDTANGVVSVAGRTVDFICAGADCPGDGCAAHANTILANSRDYVQASRQTVGSVNAGLDDLLSKLEAAKTAAVQCQLGSVNATEYDPNEANDGVSVTDEEKKKHVDVVDDGDGMTEEELREKREQEKKEFQAEQEEADRVRKETGDPNAWTRTREDGTTTTKTRLEEQREEEEAARRNGEEDVSDAPDDRFYDGETHP